MNANAKLNAILKETKIKNPPYFNEGNIFTKTFNQTQESNSKKVLTDEDLGLNVVKTAKKTENKEA